MERRTFRAMGTDVELLLDAPPSAGSDLALTRAETDFERPEAVLSRFRPDSELSALNRPSRLPARCEERASVHLETGEIELEEGVRPA